MIIQRVLIFATVLQATTSQEPFYQPQDHYWKFGSAETMSKTARAIVKKVLSVEQAEGVGARVRRSVGMVGRQEVGDGRGL